ncbi:MULTISPECIES: glycosyltransferase family 2 protein [Roseovarius]|uniref:glycosyltransferase family 2 protein n=2 Tax=Roseobacteraceae TaxID=2854170 RepID=UPI000CDE101E
MLRIVDVFVIRCDEKASSDMRIIVAIPSTNRCSILMSTVKDLERQTRKPDLTLLVVADESDVDTGSVSEVSFPVSVIQTERGLTIQRNAALGILREDDIMLFLDDDFLLAPDYLANLERLFQKHPDVAMCTGHVLADGIHGPGLSHDFGRRLISEPVASEDFALAGVYNCYGCNMALKANPVMQNKLRFDQRLKAYCWLEDVDFSRQVARYGKIVSSPLLRGVHLGTKTGRGSGLRFGYSQIANPIYLAKKGTMSKPRALNIMSRNLVSNVVKSLKPEPEVDRRGRLVGNFRAFKDLARGRLAPEQILSFE